MAIEHISVYPRPPRDAKNVGEIKDYLNKLYSSLIRNDSVMREGTKKDEKADRPWVYPEDYGAVGDGTTDDTAAIQAAIDSLTSGAEALGHSLGGKVMLGKARYKTTSTINTKRGVIIEGVSKEASQIVCSHAGSTFKYTDAGSYSQDELGFKNFSIWQDRTVTATSGAGIEILESASYKSLNLRIENVYIELTYVGVVCEAPLGALIDGLTVSQTVSHGIILGKSGSTVVVAATLQDCYVNLAGGDGYYVNTGGYTSFISCGADANTGHGYEILTSSGGLALWSSGAEGNTGSGIRIYNTYCDVIVNMLSRNNAHGVSINNVSSVVLLGSTLQSSVETGYGIHVEGKTGLANKLTLVGTRFLGYWSEDKIDDYTNIELYWLDKPKVYYQSGVPTEPSASDLWVDSDDNSLAIYAQPRVDSGEFRINTVDGSAALWAENLNLANYVSDNPVVTVRDYYGRTAVGYISTADSAEALGANLVPGWDFTSGWTAGTGTAIVDSNTFTTTTTGYGIYKTAGMFTAGKLYKVSVAGTASSGKISIRDSYVYWVEDYSSPVDETDVYGTAGGGSIYIAGMGGNQTIDISRLEVYEVTSVGTTGVQIVSTSGGATRNWSYVESGFNPNRIKSITVGNIWIDIVSQDLSATAGPTFDHLHVTDELYVADTSTYFDNNGGDLDLYTAANKTLELQTPVYDDLMVSVLSAKPGTANPPGFAVFKKDTGGTSTGVYTYWFDAGTEEDLFFSVQLPHTWKEGTAIMPHVHWTPATTSDGNPANQKVVWALEYTWVNIAGDFPVTETVTGSTHSPADADVVAGRHYLTELTDIAPGATQDNVSSMLVCRLYRDADAVADNYEADAGLLQFDFHYQIDTMGSREELVK